MELHEMFGLLLLGVYAGFMLGLIIAIRKDRKRSENKEEKQ